MEKSKTKNNKNIYWDDEVEQNVEWYIKNRKNLSKSEEERFFREKLYHKFYMLSENILKTYNNRYGFNRIDEEFENLIYDCVSEIYLKLHYFDPDRNTKAFSYFGTLVKHYLLRRAIKTTTTNKVKDNLEDYDDIEFEKNYHFIKEDNADEVVKEEEQEKILQERLWCLRKVIKEKEFTDLEKKVIETFLILYENSENLDFYNKKYIYVLMNEINNIDKKHFYPALKKFMKEHDKFWEENLWN